MIKVGRKYKPVSSRPVKGGAETQFSIPQSHRDSNGNLVYDGFLNILCTGKYPWVKGCGDMIEIKKIIGASRRTDNDKVFVGLICEIEYHTAKQMALAKEDGGSWDDDIPDELL